MAKKASPVLHKRMTIDELAAEVNKTLKGGQHLLIKGSEARQDVPRITTGLLAYDLALGGGWAANQWNEIIGEESSGKTALAYKTIAANMQRDPEWIALWVAAEEYVPEYAASFGVDLDRLWVVESNEMEKALNLVIKAVENRSVDCVVLDSIPALVTATEVAKDMEEASVATGAQILSRFFKKCTMAQRRSLTDPDDRPCTLIAINQWRDKIGVMFGDPRTTPGGKAKNYYYFTRMELRRDEWIQEQKSNIDSRVGQSIKMRVIKNKTYRPQQVAVVDFYFADSPTLGFKLGEFDEVKDVVNVALALELFEGRYKFNGERVGNSKEELYERVREDIGLRRELWQAALSRIASESHTSIPLVEIEPPSDEEFVADFLTSEEEEDDTE